MTPGDHSILAEVNVSRESPDKLQTYVDLLLAWQKRINLIGPSTAMDIWDRHIADSLQLLPLLPSQTRTIAELGSGAGIPGLVIAIAQDLSCHLYESNQKKAAFLRAAARVTQTRADIHVERLERLQIKSVPAVDCVVARALAPLPLLLDYAEPFLSKGAVGLFHKGQDADAELTEAAKYWKLRVTRHPSRCDSRGVILEIHEAIRV